MRSPDPALAYWSTRRVRAFFGASAMWVERRLRDSRDPFPPAIALGLSNRRFWSIEAVKRWASNREIAHVPQPAGPGAE